MQSSVRRLSIRLLTTVLAASPFRVASPQGTPTERNTWNREGAASYLDARMDLWFANAKKLRTGEGTSRSTVSFTGTCVRCTRKAFTTECFTPARHGRLAPEDPLQGACVATERTVM